MKMSVLYHTRTGITERMAKAIAEGMNSSSTVVEAKTFALDAIDADFVKESRCVVLGTPTYLATMAGAVKTWLDGSARQYELAGKIGGGFATADYIHGGGDIAVQSIVAHLMVLGMLTYSGGGAQGKPVIHLGPVALKEYLDDCEPTFRLYGQRMAGKTLEIFGGK